MSRLMLRNSERQNWKRCRHQWEWGYKRELEPVATGTALRFGDLVHRALAEYYIKGIKRGSHPAAAFERLYNEQAHELKLGGFDVFSDDKWEPALALGIGMLKGYVERYQEEDLNWEVLSTEQTFQIRLRTPVFRVLPHEQPRSLPFWIVGTFDGVWKNRHTDAIIFKEFKTCASIALDGLPMDEQAGTYWTYGPKWLRQQGVLKPGELPSSIMYTFLRKALPNPNDNYNELGQRLNKDGSVSKRQMTSLFERLPVYRDETERRRMHERVCAEMMDIARARAGSPEIHTYKNPGSLHMPNCRFCSFRDACEVHEAGGDFEAVLAETHRPWSPYASHELAERH